MALSSTEPAWDPSLPTPTAIGKEELLLFLAEGGQDIHTTKLATAIGRGVCHYLLQRGRPGHTHTAGSAAAIGR